MREEQRSRVLFRDLFDTLVFRVAAAQACWMLNNHKIYLIIKESLKNGGGIRSENVLATRSINSLLIGKEDLLEMPIMQPLNITCSRDG